MKINKTKFAVVALATVVGVNAISVLPTSAAPADKFTISAEDFSDVVYGYKVSPSTTIMGRNDHDKHVIAIDDEESAITAGSEYFDIVCEPDTVIGAKAQHGPAVIATTGCEVSLKSGLDASETPYTGVATIVYTKIDQGPAKHSEPGSATLNLSAVVDKADITPVVSIESWTYGDTANTPVVSGNLGEAAVTYEYNTANANEWTETAPVDAGNYQVRATVAESQNYNGAETEAVAFSIIPRAITIDVTANTSTYIYDGTEKTVSGFIINSVSDSLYDKTNINSSAAGLKYVSAIDAGRYPFELLSSDFANTNANFNVTFKVNSGSLNILEQKAKPEHKQKPSVKAPDTGISTEAETSAISVNAAYIVAGLSILTVSAGVIAIRRKH